MSLDWHPIMHPIQVLNIVNITTMILADILSLQYTSSRKKYLYMPQYDCFLNLIIIQALKEGEAISKSGSISGPSTFLLCFMPRNSSINSIINFFVVNIFAHTNCKIFPTGTNGYPNSHPYLLELNSIKRVDALELINKNIIQQCSVNNYLILLFSYLVFYFLSWYLNN